MTIVRNTKRTVETGDGGAGRLLAGGDLLHAIQSAASPEPCDLEVVEAVVQLDLLCLSVGVLDLSGDLLSWCERGQSEDRNLISWLDLK